MLSFVAFQNRRLVSRRGSRTRVSHLDNRVRFAGRRLRRFRLRVVPQLIQSDARGFPMIVPRAANADEQLAAACQLRNQFVIVIRCIRPHLPLVFGRAGRARIVSGRAQHGNHQQQTSLEQTERHRVRFSLLAKRQEHKNARAVTIPKLYWNYPDGLGARSS